MQPSHPASRSAWLGHSTGHSRASRSPQGNGLAYRGALLIARVARPAASGRWPNGEYVFTVSLHAYTPGNTRGSRLGCIGAAAERVNCQPWPYVAWRRQLVEGLAAAPVGPERGSGQQHRDIEWWRWWTNGGSDRSLSYVWFRGSVRTGAQTASDGWTNGTGEGSYSHAFEGLRNPPRSWIGTVGPSLPGFTITPCVDSLLCSRSIRQPKSILQDGPKV
jgi:hypothetical protein